MLVSQVATLLEDLNELLYSIRSARNRKCLEQKMFYFQ